MLNKNFALMFFGLLLITSCDDGVNSNNSETFNVKVSTSPTNAGFITPSPDSIYDKGSEISLIANSLEEYVFTKWTGDIDSTVNPLKLSVNQDYTLTAVFEKSNWKIVHGNYPEQLEHIYFVNDETGFIFGRGGSVLKTTNAGNDWASIGNLSQTANVTDVNFIDVNKGYITVYDPNAKFSDQLFKTTDGGVTWTQVDTDLPYDNDDLKINPRSVYFYNENLGFVGGSDGSLAWQGHFNIYKTTDGGSSWSGVQSGRNGNPIIDFYFVDENTGFAVKGGNNGTGVDASIILKTRNGGTTWNDVFSENYSINIAPIKFLDTNTGFIANVVSPEYSGYPNIGTIAKTSNGGSAWEVVLGKIGGIDIGKIRSFDFINSVGFAIDTKENIYKSLDNGNTWSEEFLNFSNLEIDNYGFSDIMIVNENLAFIVGYPGIILKYEK